MQLTGLSFLCLLATTSLVQAVVVQKSSAGSAKSVSSSATASKWGPFDLGLGASGDLPTVNADSGMIDVPGEGMIQDEMASIKQVPLALRQDAPRHQPLLAKKPLSLAKMQAQGYMMGAELESGSAEPEPVAAVPAPVMPKAKVLEEYDVVDDQDDEHSDDYRTVPMEESKTAEQVDRVRRGDVEKAKPVVHKKPKAIVKKLKLTAASQEVKAAATETHLEDQAPGNDKMLGQCMAFAGWVKSQGSTGPDLVRIWKGTCMPAVMAGNAPPAYSNMCNALGTAVSKFAVRPWEPSDMCQAVLQVFRESGVGSTPLR